MSTLPPLLDTCRPLVRPNGGIVGSEIAAQTRSEYPTLLSCIPRSPRNTTVLESFSCGTAFLAALDGRRPLTHAATHAFIQDFGETLHALGVGRGQRVALVLPNGPELALAILAVSQWTGCVPLSATGAVSELQADLARCGPDLVIGPYSNGPLPIRQDQTTTHIRNNNYNNNSNDAALDQLARTTHVMQGEASRDWTVHHHVRDVADTMKIAYVGLVPDPDMAGPFKLWVPLGRKTKATLKYDEVEAIAPTPVVIANEDTTVDPQPNRDYDEALVLFTSGTTGNKKLVPHCMGDLLTAATVIALSWRLEPSDVNCNLMPLFHVGGIVRQVFSPLVSGSCVICCPNFDAGLFWALLEQQAFNWYYAAPTMHQIILSVGQEYLTTTDSASDKSGYSGTKKYSLKMIANAAGGLLPSLALELRKTFGANVLPSYGMTECMPISSPPADYKLTKPGTSGVPVGPEVAILNTATVQPLPPNTEGPICVRGEPCFRGYGVLADDPDAAKPSSFLEEGWFDTGDLGYLDEDGYLYITGRSKEVINRGGEIIPPMEVEEAVLSHPDVKACAAFSAAHAVLQETVGIVVVLEKDDRRTLDLPTLQAHVADKLAAPKWPQCLVYMDGLPKSHTNKLLRVKLGSRLGLPEMTDDLSVWARTFEAKCPPQGAPLTDSIPSQLVTVDPAVVQASLRDAMDTESIFIAPYPNRPGAVVAYVSDKIDRRQLIDTAISCLHRYAVPTHVCCVIEETFQDLAALETLTQQVPNPKDAVASILNADNGSNSNDDDEITKQVLGMFVDLLKLDYIPTSDAHFFHIGGSSMLASQLAGKIRKTFNVSCNGAEIFHHATSRELGEVILHRQKGDGSSSDKRSPSDPKLMDADRSDHGAPFANNHVRPQSGFFSTLFQLFPMFILFPMWQIARYLLFFTLLLEKSRFFLDVSDRDMVTFLLAYLVYHLLWITVVPLIFVAIKWLVIGRYQAGRYPIWGTYYLRWWVVDICRKMFLRGIWGTTDGLLRFYYRLLGANIATGARISLDCDFAEYDLVEVGRNAGVELCTLRGFGVDNGAMILGPVRVGHESSVGIRTVVAPFTEVPDGQHLGPITSTYDQVPGKSLSKNHARVNRRLFPEPSMTLQVFLGMPIMFIVSAFSQIPPMTVLYLLLCFKSRENTEYFFSNWNELIDWLCDYRRIPFFIGIRLMRALVSPFFYMFAAIIVKRTVIGNFTPGKRNVDSNWENFRYWLAAALFSRKKLQKCTELIGRHYEYVSIMYRCLGSKVGKRVFWPGSQPVTDGTFDLLEIGDDVVFGSRSAIFCTTYDHAERVVLCAGANVSDNTVVMAGSVVGKGAVLGSNSYCPEGTYLPSASVWFGSNGCTPTCLDAGDGSDSEFYQPLNEGSVREGDAPNHASAYLDPRVCVMKGDETTVRPFGKAFYQGKATGYRVLGLSSIVLFTWVNRIFQVIFHLLPLLAAIQFGAVLLYTDNVLKQVWRNSIFQQFLDFDESDDVNHDAFLWWQRDYTNDGHFHSFFEVYMAILSCFIVAHFFRVVAWLIIELSAKYLLMGRRKPGRYNYDNHPYAQRWEMYQLISKIRKLSRLNLLQFISGTPFMNAYFRWNGGKVGKDCCLYPSGADPFMPEPDLVTIGDYCVVDCASIVCHLNTRGNFELQRITIEDKCTLRTRSRLQQGVVMETGSQLLEKSLAMTGEVVDSRSVWQGGPASQWFRYKDEAVVGTYSPPFKSLSSPEIEFGRMV